MSVQCVREFAACAGNLGVIAARDLEKVEQPQARALTCVAARAHERQHAHARQQQARGAQADVATTDDEHARTPKARGQRAERALV